MLSTMSIDLPSLVHGGTAPVYCEDGVTRLCHQAGNRLRHGYVYVNHRRVYGHIAFIPGESIWRFAAQGKHAWLAQPVPVLDTRVEG